MNRTLLHFFIVMMVLSSCSIQRQVARVAEATILSDPGFQAAHVGIAIFDPAHQKYIFNYQGEKYFVPASNTKLLTCYAAMKYLGDSLAGISYKILNDSTVAISGTGDPTILHPDFSRQPAIDFLKRFNQIDFISNGYTEFLGNGWAWDDYMDDYMAARSAMPLYGDLVSAKIMGDSI